MLVAPHAALDASALMTAHHSLLQNCAGNGCSHHTSLNTAKPTAHSMRSHFLQPLPAAPHPAAATPTAVFTSS